MGSSSVDALVEKCSRGQKGVTGSLRYLGEEPWAPLPDRDLVSHLWKMATALHFYYARDVAIEAATVLVALTDFRDTMH